MIIPEKKKAAGIIVSKYHPDGSFSEGGQVKQSPQDSDMSEHLQAKSSHADSMINAMHNKDPHALVEAMDNFLREHQLHQDKEDEPSDYSPKK